MPQGTLLRLQGITAHFRDPRFNTGKVGTLPLHTLVCPPPSTIHGLLCAARGGWVRTDDLVVGWRIEYTARTSDLQTCWLPKRSQYSRSLGLQKSVMSPRDRLILCFPRLSMLLVSGVDVEWFRSPANALCLGRSEDLVVGKEMTEVEWDSMEYGVIEGQCLPIGLASGTLYSAPLYFEAGRRPVGMGPKTDTTLHQHVRSSSLACIRQTGEAFYLWRFGRAS
jgi:CRISPR-associated Cas5-like protein